MSTEVKTRKKLIEVALPLKEINEASAREKSIRHGHPSTLHLWWARRPLAAARAVIFAQMVDDPSAHPELFPTEEAQQQERERLFDIIKELVQWENTTNETVLNKAREEIWKSWRRTCAENQDHPRAEELFNPEKLPAFHDPFAGGGSLPLEAQRLGLEAYASDLNPVAVLINKAMIEIPPKFAGRPPVNPESRRQGEMAHKQWHGAQGLAEDVRHYGKWMRDEAEKRIGHLYPKVEITAEMTKDRPDLKPLVGRKLTVIAWLWARTVKSPNPAFAKVDVPLASTFMLSSKPGKEAYIEPVIKNGGYRFTVKVGKPKDKKAAEDGTKLARGANFQCVMSGSPISGDYIKAEGQAGRIGTRLMCTVAETNGGKVFLSPKQEMESIASVAQPKWEPDGSFVEDARAFTPYIYGLTDWRHLFTRRQLCGLTTFSGLIGELGEQVNLDAKATGLRSAESLEDGGAGARAYAEALQTFLAFATDRCADYWSSLALWAGDFIAHTFGRNALSMTWDFAECNPFSDSTGCWTGAVEWVTRAIGNLPATVASRAEQADATIQNISTDKVVSTDPPYFDNVPYADLSDFFYVWLRASLRPIFRELFSTLAVPKSEELVVTSYRRTDAEFVTGMTEAMTRLTRLSHPAYPTTIYYAFKQAETDSSAGTASTGWEVFLDAVIRAGFTLSGTLPMRTERPGRLRESGSNALASSIILVCRPREAGAPIATRREFINALKGPTPEEKVKLIRELDRSDLSPIHRQAIKEKLEENLPAAVAHLQKSNIAPVDLAQAAIGPGMAIYTRYSKVMDAEGQPLPVREALALINQTLDEVLAEQEGDFDADTRWALAWFEQSGFAEGEYGIAETLSKAKNTSIVRMEHANLLKSKAGKVRLLRPEELRGDWDPVNDSRLTVWEAVHHLVRRLEKDGESGAAELAATLGGVAETARELAYRLYTICERKKRAQEALSYNALVQSWPEISRLARERATAQPQPKQAEMYA